MAMDENHVRDVLGELCDWETLMGGFDAPVWDRVRALREKLRSYTPPIYFDQRVDGAASIVNRALAIASCDNAFLDRLPTRVVADRNFVRATLQELHEAVFDIHRSVFQSQVAPHGAGLHFKHLADCMVVLAAFIKGPDCGSPDSLPGQVRDATRTVASELATKRRLIPIDGVEAPVLPITRAGLQQQASR